MRGSLAARAANASHASHTSAMTSTSVSSTSAIGTSSSAKRKSLGVVYSRGLPCSAGWRSMESPSGGSRATIAASVALTTESGSPALAASTATPERSSPCSSARRWKRSRSG